MKRSATAAGVVGLFVIVMLTASVQGIPTLRPPDLVPPGGETLDILEETASPAPPPTQPPEPAAGIAGAILNIVFLFLGIAVAALIVFLIVRALVRLWRDRPLRRREGTDVGIAATASDESQETDAAAPAIRRGIDGALRSIDERAIPGDAIIAAWVGLEESAADAGLTRGRSETPAEFALRIITRRTGITEAATALLELYERVRFGGYVADERDRDAARTALKTIETGWR